MVNSMPRIIFLVGLFIMANIPQAIIAESLNVKVLDGTALEHKALELKSLEIPALNNKAFDNLELDIEVVGLFSNAVMLRINGKQRLLKQGETSSEGIYLEHADSRGALIQYQGQRHALSLSQRISSEFHQPTSARVAIQINNKGQYFTTGSINGRPVRLLVDTGATIVALSSESARMLGLDYSGGRKMRATTAGGVVNSTEIILETVIIGDIKVSNVRAAVIAGQFPNDILLGMTFLKHVKIEENAGLMLLTSQF